MLLWESWSLSLLGLCVLKDNFFVVSLVVKTLGLRPALCRMAQPGRRSKQGACQTHTQAGLPLLAHRKDSALRTTRSQSRYGVSTLVLLHVARRRPHTPKSKEIRQIFKLSGMRLGGFALESMRMLPRLFAQLWPGEEPDTCVTAAAPHRRILRTWRHVFPTRFAPNRRLYPRIFQA